MLTLASHGAALVAALSLPGAWRLTALAVLSSLGYQLWVHVLRRAPWSIVSATWAADGSWALRLRSGAEIDARLSAATFVSQYLVVLNLRCGRWRRFALPLFGDALDPDTLRRLRVRLRLEGAIRHADPPAA
jgi:toxin CptA